MTALLPAIIRMFRVIADNPIHVVISLAQTVRRNIRLLMVGYLFLMVITFIVEFVVTFSLSSIGVQQADPLSLWVHGSLLLLGDYVLYRAATKRIVKHFGLNSTQ